MFDRLSDGFSGAFRKLSGRGSISEANVREAIDEVRTALLEADVHFDVVNDFCSAVVQDALGREITSSLKPGQEMIGIVHERLVELLGGSPEDGGREPGILHVSPGPTIVMMCGLQGSGKTTTCGKLARMLKEKGWNPMLVAADLQRPAAIEQLKVIGEQIGVPVYSEPPQESTPVQVCRNGLKAAKAAGDIKVLILDTAGRLHVDDELMSELELIDTKLGPDQALLVCDAMTGQEAVNAAGEFNKRVGLTGLILSKMDGDARGGAALSITSVTGVPIKFMGVGEKSDALEPFYPDRLASRILGMGDMLTLIEKAQGVIDVETAQEMERKLRKATFDLQDFLDQLRAVQKMGPLGQVLEMIPGMKARMGDQELDEGHIKGVEAIVLSMTPRERREPDVLNASRRRRIATGSGTSVQEVNQLLNQFRQMQKMMKQMSRGMGKGLGSLLGM